MQKKKTFCWLVLIGVCLFATNGCLGHKAAETIGTMVVAKTIEQGIAPAFELANSTEKFQEQNGRWPSDYAELRSFSAARGNVNLTNYDLVDFTPKPDGSVAILAIGPGVTNRMTLSSTNKIGN